MNGSLPMARQIKKILDTELPKIPLSEESLESRDQEAIKIFQRIFSEILRFDVISGTFRGFGESVSVENWNKLAQVEKAFRIAESRDFRIVYIQLKKLTRTAQRFAIRSMTREGWARKGEFIAIFCAPDSRVWHLVSPYVEEGLDLTGRIILRRYVLGVGENHRTVSENLVNMDASLSEPLFDRIQKAFRLQTVTKEFYKEYKNAFNRIKEFLIDDGLEIVSAKKYSHLLLNRLMFVYFIQKKGWINDDKNFIKWYLQAYKETKEKDRFHSKWLDKLFFTAMNKPKTEKHISIGFPSEICNSLNNIPFLNGGLFDTVDVDDLDIEIPDSLIFNILEGFLDNYNFTITEESPVDLDIAVDPAMLGKIYESLIAEEERGKAGIFYTPRIEVDLMCRLALFNYFIQGHEDIEEGLDGLLLKELLKPESHEKIIEFLFTPLEEWDFEKADEFNLLKTLFSKVKIVDPACGSGAFLVGMMQVLVELNRKLGCEPNYALKEKIVNENLYGVDIKDWAIRMAEFRLWLALIESEIEIPEVEPVLPNFTFKLQHGDSIVQTIGGEYIKLGKLSHKLSSELKKELEELEKLKSRHFDGEKDLVDEIKQKQVQLLDGYIQHRIDLIFKKKKENQQITLMGDLSLDAKKQIAQFQEEINELQDTKERLHEAGIKGLFLWDLAFPEVMLYGGFDIVITNPPYVRQEKIINQGIDPDQLAGFSIELIKNLKDQYKGDLLQYVLNTFDMEIGRRSDLYVYFFFKGIDLLRPNGTLVYISSNSWIDVDFGKYLQEGLLRFTSPRYVIDNKAKRSFEESEINTIITVANKSPVNQLDGNINFVMFNDPFEEAITVENMHRIILKKDAEPRIVEFDDEKLSFDTTKSFRIVSVCLDSLWRMGKGLTADLNNQTYGKKNLEPKAVGNYFGNKWGRFLRAPDIYFYIVDMNKDKLTKFGKVVDIQYGIKTGANEFFYVWDVTEECSDDDITNIVNISKISSIDKVRKSGLRIVSPSKFNKEERSILFLIEKKDLIPGVQNTSEHDNLRIITPQIYLFSPNNKPGKYSAKYIKWGESQRYNSRSSCRSRKKWWKILDSGTKHPANIGFNYNIHDTGHFFYSKTPLAFSDNFHLIYTDDRKIQVLGESTLSVLFINAECRVPFGGGKAKLQKYELEEIPFLDLTKLSKKEKKSLESVIDETDRKIKVIFEEIGTSNVNDVDLNKIEKSRRKIDEIVMGEILGLSDHDQIKVYQGIVDLIKSRFKKAESV